jgi:hypothetical protein
MRQRRWHIELGDHGSKMFCYEARVNVMVSTLIGESCAGELDSLSIL